MRTVIYDERDHRLGYCENGLIHAERKSHSIGSYDRYNEVKDRFGTVVGCYDHRSVYSISSGYKNPKPIAIYGNGFVYFAKDVRFGCDEGVVIGTYVGPDGGAAAAALVFLYGDLL